MDTLSFMRVAKYKQIFALLSPTGLITFILYLSAVPRNRINSDTVATPAIMAGKESKIIPIKSSNESKVVLIDLQVLSFGLNEFAYFVDKPVCVSSPNKVVVYGASKARWQKLFNFFEVRML